MPMVMLDLVNASEKIRGLLSRRLLEVRAGLFVGALSKRAIEQMWAYVVENHSAAALIAYPAKNEIGIGIQSCGEHGYTVVDNHGLPLVSYRRKSV